ncbi:class I SAM-dependent methyltransferase [Candidatus Micrarchaeota archaeon]|nr:class I SAM-dependent methyltransferase [Candidatus Micrarchaeota archaeon]MBU1939807.1 class I SAM-dependent methyltransferase [Candidatus Micrarchaeota archaeon]
MDRTKNQEEFFSSQAEGYERLYGAESEFEGGIVEKRRELVRSSEKSGMALDLGTGTGTYLPEISGKAKTVIALDISPKMLAIAGRRLAKGKMKNVHLVIADAQALPLKPEKFDTVYCINTFYHVPNRDMALMEMHRVMKNRGIAFIEFYNILHPFVFARTLFNMVSPKWGFVYAEFLPSFRRRLEGNGFSLAGDFSAISYVETSQAVRRWLPAFLFRALRGYEGLSARFTFIRPPKMRCAVRIMKGK